MLKRLALLLPLIAGCNIIEDLKPKVSPQNAFVAGNAGGQSAENSANQYAPPGGAAFTDGDCGVGTYADVDLDGWPDAATSLSWDTCVKDSALGTVTIDGSVTLTDSIPGTRSLDFSANPIGLDVLIVDSADGINLAATLDGSATGTAPNTVVWDAVQTWTGTIEDNDIDIDESVEWTTVYTAAGWQAGDPLADGTLSITGDWSATVNGDTVNSNVKTLDANGAEGALTITGTCESKITAGTLFIKWNNGPNDGKISVTWTGCNDRSVDVDL